VTGPTLPAPLTDQIKAPDNMILRFHVPPGQYVVKARKELSPRPLVAVHQTREPLTAHMTWWPFEAPESMRRAADAATRATTTPSPSPREGLR
jgi:hypothetical protein